MDRTIRIIIALTALTVALFVPLPTFWRVIVFAVAAIAFATAVSGYCPLNHLLRADTSGREPPIEPPAD